MTMPTPAVPAFAPLRDAMRRQVDAQLFTGLSWALLRGRDVVELSATGHADAARQTPLAPGHIFRVYSNTKLVTSCAALMLWQEGRFGLDDPVEHWLPQLGARRVLRPGATRIDDTEPAKGPITVRHLMTHTSGLSLGLLDPGTLIYDAYVAARVRDRRVPLEGMLDALAGLPLVHHPGTGWEYSVATDVLGRLIEVLSGQPLDRFFAERIFGPLGMVDTGFWVPEAKAPRLVDLVQGADLLQPMVPGLTRVDDDPPGALLRPMPRLAGGGGLVSTLTDWIRLLQSLMPGGPTLLKPATIELMTRNHVAEGLWVRFPATVMTGLGHGLAGAVTVAAPVAGDPAARPGEFRWGGIAGTQWWISPRDGVAGILMAQRQMAFFHPLAGEFKRLAYGALGVA